MKGSKIFNSLAEWHKYKASLPKIQADLSNISEKEVDKICLALGISNIDYIKHLNRGVIISKLFGLTQGAALYYKVHNQYFVDRKRPGNSNSFEYLNRGR